jgi:diguanylate cyclase (GGDEF)-like protein
MTSPGWPTAAMFVERLRQALDQRPHGGTRVLLIDLDRFKTINDTFGHTAGDRQLILTAERIVAALAPADTAARLGGDEVAVLLADSPTPRELSEVAAALADVLAQPASFQSLDLQLSAGIGSAEAAEGDTLEDLLQRADRVMYAQKSRVDRRRTPAAPATPQLAHADATEH